MSPAAATKAALHRWLVDDRLVGQRLVAVLARAVQDFGNRNPGWYGAEEIPALTGSWRRFPFRPLRQAAASLSRQLDYDGDQIFTRQIWRPIAGAAGNNLTSLRESHNPELQRGDRYLERLRPSAGPSRLPPSFSIITPYYRHFGYFRDCARSVARAMGQAGSLAVEWVVVNDDPSTSCDQLWSVVPSSIRQWARLIENTTNLGNTATLNVAIRASRFEWILFLDCDDVIARRAPRVLSKYIAAYPRCRYFSSSMVDIDQNGRVLRYRIRDTKATQLFTEGMTAGHLKAIRRDAFDELGLLDARYDGSQDREFSLRLATVEPICFVPEFLYGYRSHGATQTLSGLERQFARSRQIRQLYLERIARLSSSQSDATAMNAGELQSGCA